MHSLDPVENSRMTKTRSHGGRSWLALVMLALMPMGAHATTTVDIKFDTGWITGTVTGLLPPWPISFSLEGSFAANSTASIGFGDGGVSTLSVNPLDPLGSRRVVISFLIGTFAPTIDTYEGKFAVPMLQTFDSAGVMTQSVRPIGAVAALALANLSPLPSAVPEPASAALMCCGLALLAMLTRRQWTRRCELLGDGNDASLRGPDRSCLESALASSLSQRGWR